MIAYQCDRCGVFITESTAMNFKNSLLMKKYPIVPMKFEEEDHSYRRVMADLCGKCTESYMWWLENGPNVLNQKEEDNDSQSR